jgi:hypothetical protein
MAAAAATTIGLHIPARATPQPTPTLTPRHDEHRHEPDARYEPDVRVQRTSDATDANTVSPPEA